MGTHLASLFHCLRNPLCQTDPIITNDMTWLEDESEICMTLFIRDYSDTLLEIKSSDNNKHLMA